MMALPLAFFFAVGIGHGNGDTGNNDFGSWGAPNPAKLSRKSFKTLRKNR